MLSALEQQALVRDAVPVADLVLSGYLARFRYMRPFAADLQQDAYMGLIRAARSFDPSRGCSFGSYASDWVRTYLKASAPMYLHTVHVPRGSGRAFGRTRAEDTDTAPEPFSDPREDLEHGDSKAVSDRVQRRLRAEVGVRDAALWWETAMRGDTLADAGQRRGLSRERARQISDRVQGVFYAVTSDIRAEA